MTFGLRHGKENELWSSDIVNAFIIVIALTMTLKDYSLLYEKTSRTLRKGPGTVCLLEFVKVGHRMITEIYAPFEFSPRVMFQPVIKVKVNVDLYSASSWQPQL